MLIRSRAASRRGGVHKDEPAGEVTEPNQTGAGEIRHFALIQEQIGADTIDEGRGPPVSSERRGPTTKRGPMAGDRRAQTDATSSFSPLPSGFAVQSPSRSLSKIAP